MKSCCVCILDLNKPKLCGQLNMFTWNGEELRLHKSFFTTKTSGHQYWNLQLPRALNSFDLQALHSQFSDPAVTQDVH